MWNSQINSIFYKGYKSFDQIGLRVLIIMNALAGPDFPLLFRNSYWAWKSNLMTCFSSIQKLHWGSCTKGRHPPARETLWHWPLYIPGRCNLRLNVNDDLISVLFTSRNLLFLPGPDPTLRHVLSPGHQLLMGDNLPHQTCDYCEWREMFWVLARMYQFLLPLGQLVSSPRPASSLLPQVPASWHEGTLKQLNLRHLELTPVKVDTATALRRDG